MRTVEYEWDVETVADEPTADYEAGEVLEHWHQPSKADALRVASGLPRPTQAYKVVLVRDDDAGRSWAYLNADGTMPTHFADAYGRPTHKVPARFRKRNDGR